MVGEVPKTIREATRGSSTATSGQTDVLIGSGTRDPATGHTLLRFVENCGGIAAWLPVDMLSPGAMPSSTGCSVDCGLGAGRLTVGG